MTERIAYLRREYGVTAQEFFEMLEGQYRQCAICSTGIAIDTLHFDHDHATGKPRGLLCALCNKGLGHFKDDPELLKRAVAYLCKEEPSEQVPAS